MLLVIISRYTSQRVWLSCIGPLVLLLPKHEIIWLSNLSIMSVPDEGFSRNMRTKFDIYVFYLNKGNNKITEHRAIFQRERQNSQVNKQTNQSTTGNLGKPQWPWLGTGISVGFCWEHTFSDLVVVCFRFFFFLYWCKCYAVDCRFSKFAKIVICLKIAHTRTHWLTSQTGHSLELSQNLKLARTHWNPNLTQTKNSLIHSFHMKALSYMIV